MLLRLFVLCFMFVPMFADDVWFVSPQPHEQINGKLTIKVQPPYDGKAPVRIMVKEEFGMERPVWSGSLTPQNNYTTTINVASWKPGLYEIDAKYFIGREDYDGDVEVWIGNNNTPQDQHYPQ